jgi:hypothetical protein
MSLLQKYSLKMFALYVDKTPNFLLKINKNPRRNPPEIPPVQTTKNKKTPINSMSKQQQTPTNNQQLFVLSNKQPF